MDLLIVSGMSGSGKSTAMNALEDLGYFCIDNFPAALLPYISKVVQNYKALNQHVAITLDIRSLEVLDDIPGVFEMLDEEIVNYQTIFLDSGNEVLLRRFKETRRNHPLMSSKRVDLERGIELEREYMADVKNVSDYIIDTSMDGTAQLKQKINLLFGDGVKEKLQLNLVSFGFKHGMLQDADLLFDVRCLSNPYYVPELRHKTGLDQEVRDYVMGAEVAQGLFKHIEDYLKYSLPLYKLEGKSQLVVGIACTGGKHRSVTFAKLLGEALENEDVLIQVHHRDILRK